MVTNKYVKGMLSRGSVLLSRLNRAHWNHLICNFRPQDVNRRPVSSKPLEYKSILVKNRSNFGVEDDGLVSLADAEGVFYVGQISKGVYNGEGKCTMYQHETYTGQFVDGKRSGNGVVIYNKKTLDPTLVANTISSELVVHAINSASIDKSNTDNLISYEGEWHNNKYHGYGLLKFRHGSSYEGSFVEGRFQGSAEYKFENGDVYTGMFHDDTASGRGKYTGSDGDIYIGDFANGVFHGHGTYDMNNGMSYEGEWQNGQMHGQGRLYSRENEEQNMFKGRFAHGDFIEGDKPSTDQQGENGEGSDNKDENVMTMSFDTSQEEEDDPSEEREILRQIAEAKMQKDESVSLREGFASNDDKLEEETEGEEGKEAELTPEEKQLLKEIAHDLNPANQNDNDNDEDDGDDEISKEFLADKTPDENQK